MVMRLKGKLNYCKIKNEGRKIYYKKCMIKTNIKLKENKKDYYAESINALIEYMKKYEKNPNEKQWNKYAIQNRYLLSKTIGYLSKVGFNTLCRNLRKQINKQKRTE